MLLSVAIFLLLASKAHAAPAKERVIVEGDILLTKNIGNVMLNERENKKSAIKADIFRWKDGRIPYVIAEETEPYVRELLLKAFVAYSQLTCIRFVPTTSNDEDYVIFTKEHGCFSSIGRQGGAQVISLGDGCQSEGHILHELMHVIGFFHEQSRYDRDLYVKILWWNIADNAFKNFATYDHGKIDTMGFPYDKHSILHYGRQAFSKNGGNTIESIDDPNEVLGQETLSKIDVYQINKMYNC